MSEFADVLAEKFCGYKPVSVDKFTAPTHSEQVRERYWFHDDHEPFQEDAVASTHIFGDTSTNQWPSELENPTEFIKKVIYYQTVLKILSQQILGLIAEGLKENIYLFDDLFDEPEAEICMIHSDLREQSLDTHRPGTFINIAPLS
jgi:isopenicillin N synthase-like dioxygenase